MASKKYRGKTCVYCGQPGTSSTADHVIAREFFLPDQRDNLPKVPACAPCNNAKSCLEHYILSVLPMGGTHPEAATAILTQVGPRLAKNARIHQEINIGTRPRWVRQPGGIWQEGMSIPIQGQKLTALASYIALGLACHHWKTQVTPDAVADGNLFAGEGLRLFEDCLTNMDAGGRVSGAFGNGVFAYRGAYSRTNKKLTLWQMTFFGGVELGDQSKPGFTSRSVFVATNDAPAWIALHGDKRRPTRAP